MDRKRPSGVLLPNPFTGRLSFKLALGVIFLIFLSGYQPTLQFPPLKKTIAHAADNEQIKTIQAQAVSLLFQSPHPGYISTHFSGYHPGIDLATGLGMPIKPIAKGKVINTGYTFFGLGLVVEIDHGEGYRSLYAHMGATYVKVGQEVDNNNLLGEVGLTGNTSGPHTHLEVYKDGKAIDPLAVLPPLREQPQASDFIATGGSVKMPTPFNNSLQNKPAETPTPKPTPTPEPLKDLGVTLNTSKAPCPVSIISSICK